MSLQSRRELRLALEPRYRKASKKEKQSILNEFTAVTGYHRKYAIALLARPPTAAPKKRRRPRLYTAEVQQALVMVWKVANRICSRRLVPFLPELVAVLERHGHLILSAEVRARLLAISPATVDRLLAEDRNRERGTRAGAGQLSTVMKQVPVRTFAEWEGAVPGYVEADLVFHCGGDVSGRYLHTLTLTDVVTGWTECMALLFRGREIVLQSLHQAEEQLPFPLLAIDTDNGREFLNELLLGYCRDKPLIFTRSRPYKKNDQCYVEQKNGAIVRQFVGYDRFEGLEPCRILTALYRQVRLYVNFFQPSLKLISKKRVGSRIIKRYDRAQTPYQRILTAESVSHERKEKLRQAYQVLDPLQLLTRIRHYQDELWRYAYAPPITGVPTPEPVIIGNNGSNGNCKAEPQQVNGVAQKYRCSKKKRHPVKGKRWWRTRRDPFADVLPEIHRRLSDAPDLSVIELFRLLRQQHPRQFSDGQLRTLQRRVHEWRTAYIATAEKPAPASEVPVYHG